LTPHFETLIGGKNRFWGHYAHRQAVYWRGSGNHRNGGDGAAFAQRKCLDLHRIR
jgi:hypothetical protein